MRAAQLLTDIAVVVTCAGPGTGRAVAIIAARQGAGGVTDWDQAHAIAETAVNYFGRIDAAFRCHSLDQKKFVINNGYLKLG